MSPNSTGWGRWRKVLLLFLFLAAPSVGLATTKGTRKGGDSDLANMVRPDLINAQTDPTLRFPVMSMSGSTTYGWLDITSSTIRYTVVQPTRKADHDFEVSRFAVRELRFNRTVVSFKSPKKEQTIAYLPQDLWGSNHRGFGMSSAESRERLGTQSIYNTLLNFDAVLALVKPPPRPPAPVIAQPVAPAPPPKPAAPPSPPAIVLSSPPGAGEGQTLEWGESTVVIRGVAMDSTGIPVVRINGSPANMRPQTTQAAEFWSDPLPLQAGSNRIEIVASNSAQVEAKLDLTVQYKPKTAPVNPRALGRGEIIDLLQGGSPAGAHCGTCQRTRHQIFTQCGRCERDSCRRWNGRPDRSHSAGSAAPLEAYRVVSRLASKSPSWKGAASRDDAIYCRGVVAQRKNPRN